MTDPCADGGIPQIDLRIAIPHPPRESNSEPLPDVHETKFRAARFPHHRGTARPSQHVGVCTTQDLGGKGGNGQIVTTGNISRNPSTSALHARFDTGSTVTTRAVRTCRHVLPPGERLNSGIRDPYRTESLSPSRPASHTRDSSRRQFCPWRVWGVDVRQFTCPHCVVVKHVMARPRRGGRCQAATHPRPGTGSGRATARGLLLQAAAQDRLNATTAFTPTPSSGSRSE